MQARLHCPALAAVHKMLKYSIQVPAMLEAPALNCQLLFLFPKFISVLQLKYLSLDGKIIFSDYKNNDVMDTQRFYGGYDGENGFGCDSCRGET